MSKGNMLLGYARGKVGSLVFSRRKGEQITRARNTSPANPRTNAQMAQRMKMYAPVQLYRQSMRKFFKFAFAPKASETIFNAYMRENISLSPWVSKQLSVAQAPIPFPARMSAGSGPSIGVVKANFQDFPTSSTIALLDGSSSAVKLGFKLDYSGSEEPTLGELSSVILAGNTQLQVGDQITFVTCAADGLSIESGDVLYDDRGIFDFGYSKFVLDPASTLSPEDVGLSVDVSSDFCVLAREIAADFVTDSAAGAIIVTRTSGNSVIAGNSVLTLNDKATEVYNLMRTEAYKAKAAESYKATDDAYLNPATTA